MYDEYFSRDWESGELDRDEAIERAFALGVAAECGEEHEAEYRRLVAVAGRALVQMAFDDGRSRAKDRRYELRREESGDGESVEFPDRDAEIWSSLIEYETGRESALERHTRPIKRLDVPGLLRRFDLSSTRPDDLGRLRLPEFLRR